MGLTDAFEANTSYNGGGSSNGQGAGGGASDVRSGGYTDAERVIVAGGGGGTASWQSMNPTDNGAYFGEVGGAGGGLQGADGSGLAPGGGGTQTAAGAGGSATSTGQGGSGAVGGQGVSGGGGGGGYFGGGGGAYYDASGEPHTSGGGGGSGYGPAGTVFQSGVHTGDGLVIITTPPTHRPDGMIKRATSTDKYVGNNVYNATGTNQTRSWSATRGHDRAFYLKFQNDGNVADRYRLKGCGSSTGFGVRYSRGATWITSAVVDGTYRTSSLDPGKTSTIKLWIHVTSTAKIGAVKRCLVTAKSTTQTTKVDAPRAALTVIKG
jgi:hypothetical protein